MPKMAAANPASTHTPFAMETAFAAKTPLKIAAPHITPMDPAVNVPPDYSQPIPTAIVIRSMAVSENQAIPVWPVELDSFFKTECALPLLPTAKTTLISASV